MKTIFENELRTLINSNSRENASNTPDFVLAEYLNACLDAFNAAINARERFYGRPNYPNEKPAVPPDSQPVTLLDEMRQALDYLLQQTVDQDLKYGITLTEGEEDARQRALAVIAKAAS